MTSKKFITFLDIDSMKILCKYMYYEIKKIKINDEFCFIATCELYNIIIHVNYKIYHRNQLTYRTRIIN